MLYVCPKGARELYLENVVFPATVDTGKKQL